MARLIWMDDWPVGKAQVGVVMSDVEKEAIKKAASLAGKSVSQWARDILIANLCHCPSDTCLAIDECPRRHLR